MPHNCLVLAELARLLPISFLQRFCEHDDGDNDNSTWEEGDWDGDFDYELADHTFAGNNDNDYYENGYVDEDNDGVADVVPIWAIDITFSGDDTAFYLPDWS